MSLLTVNNLFASAKSYDLTLQNPRPTFSMTMSLSVDNQSVLHICRKWFAVGQDPVATETLAWAVANGLHRLEMAQPSLNETGLLFHKSGEGEFVLNSPKTHLQRKTKTNRFSHEPASLLSIPCEVAKRWDALKAGEVFYFDYVVLKVQAHTKIKVQARGENNLLVVKVTPAAWFWRLVFGSTRFYFDKDKPELRKITGLIEPRDKKHNGKYKEYLANVELEQGLDLSALVKL